MAVGLKYQGGNMICKEVVYGKGRGHYGSNKILNIIFTLDKSKRRLIPRPSSRGYRPTASLVRFGCTVVYSRNRNLAIDGRKKSTDNMR